MDFPLLREPEIVYIHDDNARVKECLDIWARWWKRGEGGMGIQGPAGFNSGGLQSWEELQRSGDNYVAENVNAIYEDLHINHRVAIDQYHIAAVWASKRTCIADDYEAALVIVSKSLRKRGVM
jgi:hypothetical protein